MNSQTERWHLVPILLRCAGLLCIALLALWPSPLADAETRGCPDVRPVVGGASSDVLGTVAELSLHWCPGAPWSLITGVRYTSQPGNLNAFISLSYEQQISSRLSLHLDATLNERSGDTLLNRLPELSLRWYPFAHHSFLVPSLELSYGSLFVYSSQAQAWRAGAIVNIAAQQIRLGKIAELTPNFRIGTFAYETGQGNNFWAGTVNLTIRPTSRTSVSVGYLRQGGSGTSALGFDTVGPDQTLSGRVGITLSPSAIVSVTANVSLQTQPSTVTEYGFWWTRPGKWSIGFTWRQSDGHVLLGAGLSP